MKRLVMVAMALALVVGVVAAPGRSNAAGGNSITSPDTGGDVGCTPSLTLDSSGNPVVGYYDGTNGDLKVMHCNDPNCSGGDESITSPDTGGDVGKLPSLALDASGNPVVSYWDSINHDLKVLHCGNPNCTSGNSITSPDTSGDVGHESSLALDAGGYPVLSYYDWTNSDLKVLHCGNPNCTSGNSITSPDTGGSVGNGSSLALDASGYPVVSYWDQTNGDLKVMHCNDPNCSGGDETITSPDTGGDVGYYPSLVLDGTGYPVVSYYDATNGDLKVMRCNDPNCSGGDESMTSPDTGGDVGASPSLALDASGNPVVSYEVSPTEDLKVLHCGNPNCTLGNSITSPDTGGSVGWSPSLALDSSGNPVVGYYDGTNEDLKILRCGSATCIAAAVGGIAELPAVAGTSRGEAGTRTGGSGWSAGNYAALAGGLAAAAVVIAVGSWYGGRRWLR